MTGTNKKRANLEMRYFGKLEKEHCEQYKDIPFFEW